MKGSLRDRHAAKPKPQTIQKESQKSEKIKAVRQEPLSDLFDRFLFQQRHDVEAYSSGHLNHQRINTILKEEKDKASGKFVFGKNNIPDNQPEYEPDEVNMSPGKIFRIILLIFKEL